MRFLFFSIVLMATFVVFGPGAAMAQTTESSQTTISVAPAIIDTSGKPGDVVANSFQISNGGTTPLPISLETESLIFDDDEIINKDSLKKVDASSWVTFDEDESFILKPKQTKVIAFKIEIPKDASPGGHYAAITVRGLSLESPTTQNSSIIIPEISLNLFITVSGEIFNQVTFAKDNILPLFLSPGSQQDLEIAVQNEGNIHDLITPMISIVKNGQTVATHEVSSRIVLPGTTKIFNTSLQIPQERGIYSFKFELKYKNGSRMADKTEKAHVGYKPHQIVAIGLLVFIIRYVFIHRKNIRSSLKILFGIS